jgi:hypothetical protein
MEIEQSRAPFTLVRVKAAIREGVAQRSRAELGRKI